MKSHTGVYITLGKGAIYCRSSKQKLVTKSSTEASIKRLNQMICGSASEIPTNSASVELYVTPYICTGACMYSITLQDIFSEPSTCH